MIIEVTQQDIDKGVKKDCRKCAVANAIRMTLFSRDSNSDKVESDFDILVGALFISINGKDYEIPKHVRAFMAEFDYGMKVHPISFELRPYFQRWEL